MTAEYLVKIKNTNGEIVQLFTSWRTLSYSKRVNAVHDVSLQLPYESDLEALFETDSQIEVWKEDKEAGLASYLDFEGLIRTEVSQIFENSRETFTVYGYGYTELLARRGIWYPTGSSFTEKSAAAETAMKEYVYENIGAGAGNGNRFSNGVLPGLGIEVDLARGATWSGSRAYRNLLAVLQEIGENTQTFFDVIGSGAGQFSFRFYQDQRGADRSTIGLTPGTGLNGAGNPPVVFSVETGNVLTIARSFNKSDEINSVLVLGQGIEEDREFALVEDAASIAVSPWNRRELSYNASQETTQAALQSLGESQLENKKAQTNLNFVPLFASATVIGRDYDWGDIITARYRDEEFHLGIIGKKVMVGEQGESISLEMSSVS